ncbi:MAG: kelch repeat-containing protein [Flavobacteriales bacterium]
MRIWFFFVVAVVCTDQVSGQTWVSRADFPGTPRDDAAAFSIDGMVYVGTGRDVSFALTNDWFAYSPASDSWVSIAPLPSTGRQYCSAFSDGTYGYLFGGIDDDGPLNELWRYDPVLDQWQQRAPLPGPERYASVVVSDRYIVSGLLAGGTATSECWEYFASLDTWTQRADLPGTPRHRASGGWSVIGGADAAYNALSDCYEFDTFNGTWTALPDLPEARYGADAFRNTVVGGATSDVLLHADVWTLREGSWTNTPLAEFPPGGRRGGVIAGASDQDGQSFYYGTGVDLVQRRSDWWLFSFSRTSINELEATALTIAPNPVDDMLHVGLRNDRAIKGSTSMMPAACSNWNSVL